MIKPIEAQSLYLRPFTIDDVEIIFSLSQEVGMRKWIPDQVYKDKVETKAVLSYLISQYQDVPKPDKAPLVLAVVLKKTNDVIGHVGLSPFENHTEVGYAIAENLCGRGYASIAVGAMCKWALSELDIRKIYGIVATENMASVRVLKKSGFLLEEEKEQPYHGKVCLCRRYYLTV